MPPSVPMTSTTGSTFDIPTLGNAVHLGQLYNARTKKFIEGVLLYDSKEIAKHTSEQNVNHSQLSLSMANSFTSKATLLDISAELSLNILSGLVKVSGSGEYLNDVKSSSQERAWAMSLMVRLKECRLLFSEDGLGGNVPKSVIPYLQVGPKENPTSAATHFVSSIVTGGSVVVRFVARNSKTDERTEVGGSLQVELEKLKGAVDLDAKAKLDIKGKFEKFEERFDISIYGQGVEQGTTPTDAKSVLEALNHARQDIGDGSSISVTLQPIPEGIVDKQAAIRRLDQARLDRILRVYDDLDRVRGRFEVLRNSNQAFAPQLAAAVNKAYDKFITLHEECIRELGKFIEEFQESGSTAGSDALESKVKDLSTIHSTAGKAGKPRSQDDESQDDEYPDTLLGLEELYADFQVLVAAIEISDSQLSTLDSVKSAFANPGLRKLALFLMPSLTSASASTNLMRFSSLVRAGHHVYSSQIPTIPDYCLYVENPNALKDFLDLKALGLENLDAPAACVGEPVLDSDEGTILWTVDKFKSLGSRVPTKLYDFDLGLHMNRDDEHYGANATVDIVHPLPDLNSGGPFTIMARARYDDSPTNTPRIFLSIKGSNIRLDFQIQNQMLDIAIETSNGRRFSMGLGHEKSRPKDKTFCVAFVQNWDIQKWGFYVDGESIRWLQIGEGFVGNISLVIDGNIGNRDQMWFGGIHDAQVYSVALTPEEVKYASNPGGENEKATVS